MMIRTCQSLTGIDPNKRLPLAANLCRVNVNQFSFGPPYGTRFRTSTAEIVPLADHLCDTPPADRRPRLRQTSAHTPNKLTSGAIRGVASLSKGSVKSAETRLASDFGKYGAIF
jgi:hypothetical protein